MTLAQPKRGVAVGDRLVEDAVLRVLAAGSPQASIWVERGAESLERRLTKEPVDLLVTAASLGNRDQLDFLARVRREGKITHLLMVMTSFDGQTLHALRGLGAEAAIDPRVDGAEQMAEALRCVECGGTYWSRTCLAVLQGDGPMARIRRILSPLELYALAVLGAGCDDGSAAMQMGVSAPAVHAYRKRLHSKLGLQHRGQLVSLAAQLGLVRFTSEGIQHPGLATLRAQCVFRARQGARARRDWNPPVQNPPR